MTRPEDSSERSFALERAVLFQSARIARGGQIDDYHVVNVAKTFLAFLEEDEK